jgi:hypothetical protein
VSIDDLWGAGGTSSGFGLEGLFPLSFFGEQDTSLDDSDSKMVAGVLPIELYLCTAIRGQHSSNISGVGRDLVCFNESFQLQIVRQINYFFSKVDELTATVW